ncbi:A/G-specific adenine glycosylase [Aureisphaera galaxeae]|uniref:A/G-specific adenine glycosylase n=1 Tax=Aureisphaera galaxeae TaxID=1538023 RepID=UPI0023504F1E|nr:A/G-specific adenine glycosylase [Aureisphaera galaxeae]MDC8002712.1 A/G-specific adenine glycosylase [Aureisphaera galaxeae]
MPKNTTFFSKKLILWYLQNGRNLPWRETRDPYHIWLSEIILQQTRVAQGMPYYLKFTETFPTVYELARAPEEKVLKLWQGLGYYSRARNLHFTAQTIVDKYEGVFPNNYKELLSLKGVGDYTASAIGSICFDLPTAVVDGNVYRVLSRVFGIDTPINSVAGIKEFKELAQLLIDEKQPGTFNQAAMEFGARHCTPQNPDCDSCIFNTHCEARLQTRVDSLPVKLQKNKIKTHYYNYIVPIYNGTTFLEQRTGKGIWQQLYQFPLVESPKEMNTKKLEGLSEYQTLKEKFGIEEITLFNTETIVHKLSHKHLHTRFWIAEASAVENGIEFSEVEKYPVPILIGNFIQAFGAFHG